LFVGAAYEWQQVGPALMRVLIFMVVVLPLTCCPCYGSFSIDHLRPHLDEAPPKKKSHEKILTGAAYALACDRG
jgi:hypothetical protein